MVWKTKFAVKINWFSFLDQDFVEDSVNEGIHKGIDNNEGIKEGCEIHDPIEEVSPRFVGHKNIYDREEIVRSPEGQIRHQNEGRLLLRFLKTHSN